MTSPTVAPVLPLVFRTLHLSLVAPLLGRPRGSGPLAGSVLSQEAWRQVGLIVFGSGSLGWRGALLQHVPLVACPLDGRRHFLLLSTTPVLLIHGPACVAERS